MVTRPPGISRIPIIGIPFAHCLEPEHSGGRRRDTVVLGSGPVITLVSNETGAFESGQRRINAPPRDRRLLV